MQFFLCSSKNKKTANLKWFNPKIILTTAKYSYSWKTEKTDLKKLQRNFKAESLLIGFSVSNNTIKRKW